MHSGCKLHWFLALQLHSILARCVNWTTGILRWRAWALATIATIIKVTYQTLCSVQPTTTEVSFAVKLHSLHVVHCAVQDVLKLHLHCRSRWCRWCTEKIIAVQGSSAVHILSAFYFEARCKSTWCRWCTEKSVGSSAKSGPIWQAALLAHLKLSSFIPTIGIGGALKSSS